MAIDATTLAVLRAFVKQSGGSSPGESGQDGREIELQKSDTAIQWRYVGDQEWIDLVQLSEIKGDPGNTGAMANLTIGTVTTLAAGSNATASIESNPDGSGYVLNLGIPEGEDGSQIADYVNLNNKPSINGVEISGDKSAEDYGLKPSDFIVNITRDWIEDTVSADKTYNEISEAYNAGMDCYAEFESQKIPLRYLNPGAAIFVDESLENIDLTTITIRSDGSVESNNSLLLPSEETYGLVKADKVTSDDTVPAKIGEDGKLYVPKYPTLESLNAQPKDFIVTISGDDVSGYTADKTYDEILEAYNAGKNCYANALGNKLPLLVFDSYQINFLLGNLERFQVLNVIINDDNTCDVVVTTSIIASSNSPGIVKAKPKDVETVQVAVDDDGKLWVPESTGGGDTINVDAELKEYMNVAKPAIASAIINKGGSVEPDDSLNDYATRISAIPNDVYPAETLPVQTNLSASGLQDSIGIKLNWSDVNASGYIILRKENAMPATSADGDIVYNGTYAADGYTDTGVQKGKVYYYRIFPRNSKNQYQSTEDGAVAMVDYKDRTGQTLINDLPLGSKIKFGEWNGSEYFWEIVDTQDKNSGYVTVAADQNLGNRQFDAPETDNPVTNRKNQGNNRWLYSAVRQLLNSSDVAGSWWTAQHEYDVAPSYATQIDGFLKDFTTYEKNIIVSKTNRCNLDTNDGSGYETMIDKVWLPSSYAMGTELFQPLEDDHVYEAYTDNASRTYQNNWWLRTINGSSSASSVRNLNSGGTLYNNSANYSNNVAVRPFCLLPTSAYMLWSDSDEAYVFVDDSQRNPTV